MVVNCFEIIHVLLFQEREKEKKSIRVIQPKDQFALHTEKHSS